MWRKNNSPIFQDRISLTTNQRLSVENNNSLIINNITVIDAGSYMCEVLGENKSVTHEVIVKGAPFNITVEAENNRTEVSIIHK